jgi:hypothetical protein
MTQEDGSRLALPSRNLSGARPDGPGNLWLSQQAEPQDEWPRERRNRAATGVWELESCRDSSEAQIGRQGTGQVGPVRLGRILWTGHLTLGPGFSEDRVVCHDANSIDDDDCRDFAARSRSRNGRALAANTTKFALAIPGARKSILIFQSPSVVRSKAVPAVSGDLSPCMAPWRGCF